MGQKLIKLSHHEKVRQLREDGQLRGRAKRAFEISKPQTGEVIGRLRMSTLSAAAAPILEKLRDERATRLFSEETTVDLSQPQPVGNAVVRVFDRVAEAKNNPYGVFTCRGEPADTLYYRDPKLVGRMDVKDLNLLHISEEGLRPAILSTPAHAARVMFFKPEQVLRLMDPKQFERNQFDAAAIPSLQLLAPRMSLGDVANTSQQCARSGLLRSAAFMRQLYLLRVQKLK